MEEYIMKALEYFKNATSAASNVSISDAWTPLINSIYLSKSIVSL